MRRKPEYRGQQKLKAAMRVFQKTKVCPPAWAQLDWPFGEWSLQRGAACIDLHLHGHRVASRRMATEARRGMR